MNERTPLSSSEIPSWRDELRRERVEIHAVCADAESAQERSDVASEPRYADSAFAVYVPEARNAAQTYVDRVTNELRYSMYSVEEKEHMHATMQFAQKCIRDISECTEGRISKKWLLRMTTLYVLLKHAEKQGAWRDDTAKRAWHDMIDAIDNIVSVGHLAFQDM